MGTAAGLEPQRLKPARFAVLTAAIAIDKMALDDELIQTPTFIQEAAEIAAEANAMAEHATKLYKEEQAAASLFVRERATAEKARITEGGVDAEVTLDNKVMTACRRAEAANWEMARWQGVVTALRAKARAMETYSQLIIAGYATRDSAQLERRRAIQGRP